MLEWIREAFVVMAFMHVSKYNSRFSCTVDFSIFKVYPHHNKIFIPTVYICIYGIFIGSFL